MRELNEGRNGEGREGMDADEFLTWAAYVTLEPFPETRIDVQTGLILQQQANMNRGKGKPAKRLNEFLPKWGGESMGNQTDAQRKEILKMTYLSMGGDPKAVS